MAVIHLQLAINGMFRRNLTQLHRSAQNIIHFSFPSFVDTPKMGDIINDADFTQHTH